LVEVNNREDLLTWLQGQPMDAATAIAARSALRFFAHVDDDMDEMGTFSFLKLGPDYQSNYYFLFSSTST
jgi:hypothetical protein